MQKIRVFFCMRIELPSCCPHKCTLHLHEAVPQTPARSQARTKQHGLLRRAFVRMEKCKLQHGCTHACVLNVLFLWPKESRARDPCRQTKRGSKQRTPKLHCRRFLSLGARSHCVERLVYCSVRSRRLLFRQPTISGLGTDPCGCIHSPGFLSIHQFFSLDASMISNDRNSLDA